MAKKLTAKQQRFVDEYLKDLNATQAYIRAGYSKNGAQASSAALLSNPIIKSMVDAGKTERSEETKIDANFVLENLAKLAGVNLEDITSINAEGLPEFDFSEVTTDQMYCLSEISTDRTIRGTGEGQTVEQVEKVKIKTVDKLKALEMLGRHLKLFSNDINFNAENFTMILDYGGKK